MNPNPAYLARLANLIQPQRRAAVEAAIRAGLLPSDQLRGIRVVDATFRLEGADLTNAAGERFNTERWNGMEAIRHILAALAFGGRAVESVVSTANSTLKKITSRWVPADVLDGHLDRANTRLGLPPGMLKKFVRLEAAKRSRGGVLEFDTQAVNSLGYTGLFQFDKKGSAWTVAANAGAKRGINLGPFKPGVFDVETTALAAGLYSLANHAILKKSFPGAPLTAEIAYAMHNQGAGGFAELLRRPVLTRNLAGQSGEAKATVRAAIKQCGVTPRF